MNDEQSQDIEILSDEQLETVDAGGGSVSSQSSFFIDLFGIFKGGKNDAIKLFW